MLVAVVLFIFTAAQQNNALQVSFNAIPPGPVYRAASFIRLNCSATGGVPPLQYRVTFGCRQTGTTEGATTLSTFVITSTGEVCRNVFVCRVTDSIGASGTAEFSIRKLTGVGLQLSPTFGQYHFHRNNSIIIVDENGRFSNILCNSASKSPNIGRWISPSGTTLTSSDATYDVQRQGGSTFPSFISLQLKSGVAVSSSQHGLYVCHIPDENGVEQTLHTWVFPRTYNALPRFVSSSSRGGIPLTLSCTFTGTPGYVLWHRIAGGLHLLQNNSTYKITDNMMENSTTTTYRGTIEMNTNNTDGHYRCQFNSRRTDAQNLTVSLQTENHFFLVRNVGLTQGFNCSWNATTTSKTSLLRDGREVVSGVNSAVIWFRPVNESIHGSSFICLGIQTDGSRIYHNFTMVVTVHPSDVHINFIFSKQNITAGDSPFILVFARITRGLESNLSISCTGPKGNNLLMIQGLHQRLIFVRIIHLTEIRTSDAGVYTCSATMITPLLPYPLVSRRSTAINITIHTPSVFVTRSTNSSIRAGEVVKLVCHAVVNTSCVNTPVRGVIKWYRHGNQTTQPIMIQPTHRIHISTNQLQSMITFTPVLMEDEGTIRCVVSLMPFEAGVSNVLPSEDGAGSYNLSVKGSTRDSDSVLFQLVLTGLNGTCQDWMMNANISLVTSAVVTALTDQCSCQYPDTFISQEHFYCSSSSATYVTYRARMYLSVTHSAVQLRRLLDSWRKSEQRFIMLSGTTLQLNRDCDININSFNDTFCDAGGRPFWETRVFLIVVTAVGATVLVVIATTIAICCMCCTKKKSTINTHQKDTIAVAHPLTSIQQWRDIANMAVHGRNTSVNKEQEAQYDYPRFESFKPAHKYY